MKIKALLVLLIAMAVAAVVWYSLRGAAPVVDYAQQITSERLAKDKFMENDDESPLSRKDHEFKPLNYFAPDPAYRIHAALQLSTSPRTVWLNASDGAGKKFLEYGVASFELDNKPVKLTILEIMEAGPYRGTLFLPFADETSARETYGAGRYLDLKKTPGTTTSIVLDFNRAYNPYCAYSPNYSCPLPPPENILPVPVRAGEKNYH